MGLSDEIKSTKFSSQRSKALVNIIYTSNFFRDIHKSILKEYKLLPQHFNVLRIVKGKYPDHICPSEIKSVMLDKGPDITRLIDKMVNMGLLDRCQNEKNRREIEIRINKKGIKILNTLNKSFEQTELQYFGLTEEEAKQLSDLLDKARMK